MKNISFLGLAWLLVHCGTSPTTIIYENGDAGVTLPEAGVVSFSISPRPLVPPFSPTTYDYYIRCNTGENPITLTTTDASGTETVAVSLTPDQALVVQDEYWVRCLPQDFPAVTVAHPSGGAPTPGYYLVSSPAYGIVFDTNGVPVWYARGSNLSNVDSPATNVIQLMPDASDGQFGTSTAAQFEVHALDTQTTTVVRAANNAPTDAHELRTLANGDHLLFTYPIESNVDLAGLSNFSASENIADCEIEEVDSSNNLVWSWLASDHVDPVTESLEPMSDEINGEIVRDVFHCNAIEVDATGNLLVSMRHACAAFYIDRTSGNVLWKVGGAPTNKDGAQIIKVGSDANGPFNMQHDARFLPNGDVSLFDDHGAVPNSGVARGVEYAIDHTANTANEVWQFLGTEEAQYEGSFRRYADGESVIGWGEIGPDPRVVSEIDPAGNEVFSISLAPNVATYRAIKVPLTQLDINLLRNTCAIW